MNSPLLVVDSQSWPGHGWFSRPPQALPDWGQRIPFPGIPPPIKSMGAYERYPFVRGELRYLDGADR